MRTKLQVKTTLMEKLQLEVPVIQAPMAGVSTPALAAAVSNAGGLGSVSIGAMGVEDARQAIEATRALTGRPFNINVFCHEPTPGNPAVNAAWLKALAPLFEELGVNPPVNLNEIYQSFNANPPMLDLLVELRPAVVSFHFGLPPRHFIGALQRAGIILLASATNLHEAGLVEQAGLDAVIAQGIEAGGHRGGFQPYRASEKTTDETLDKTHSKTDAEPDDKTDEGLTTLVLARQCVSALKIPVVAAGGIMDGAGIHAVLALGAQAAQLGTAFVACPESAADNGYRAALVAQHTAQTVLTSSISGRPARGFPNRLTEFVSGKNMPIPDYPYAYDAAKALQTAAKIAGVPGFATRWAGQGVPLSRALPAGELVRQLQAELQASGEMGLSGHSSQC